MSANKNETPVATDAEETTVPKQGKGDYIETVVDETGRRQIHITDAVEDEDDNVSKLQKLTGLVKDNRKAMIAFGLAAVAAVFAVKKYRNTTADESTETADDTAAE
jgi:hypothetical protein